MSPLAINQERFREHVCTHEISVTVHEVAERTVSDFGKERVTNPTGPTQMTDSWVPTRLHDLDRSGVVFVPCELWGLGEQQLP